MFLSFSTQSRGRTGTGVNLLVFETSASTDSAIWASDFSEMVCKYRNYFLTDKIFMNFFSISHNFVIFLAIATISERLKATSRCARYTRCSPLSRAYSRRVPLVMTIL